MEIYPKKGSGISIYEYSLIYGGLGIIILLAARFLPLYRITILCPLKTVAGIPCPACGSTRSFIHLAHLDFTGAFVMNPLISISMILGAVFFLYSIASFFFRSLSLEVKFKEKEKTKLRIGVILALTLNWLYLIIAGI